MSQLPVLTITLNQRQADGVKSMLRRYPRELPKVMSRSVNRVGQWAKTRIVRAIAADMPITQSNLRSRHVKITKATRTVWVATIKVSGKRIPLIQFKPRQLSRGLSWRTDKKKGRVRNRQAFIATMPSGHTGVFQRRGDGDDRVPRLPINELMGPSVPFVMGKLSELSKSALGGELSGRLEKEIDTQTKLVLEKKGRS